MYSCTWDFYISFFSRSVDEQFSISKTREQNISLSHRLKRGPWGKRPGDVMSRKLIVHGSTRQKDLMTFVQVGRGSVERNNASELARRIERRRYILPKACEEP